MSQEAKIQWVHTNHHTKPRSSINALNLSTAIALTQRVPEGRHTIPSDTRHDLPRPVPRSWGTGKRGEPFQHAAQSEVIWTSGITDDSRQGRATSIEANNKHFFIY